MSIASIASAQLSVLQAPEVARDKNVLFQEATLANAQAPAIIKDHDREMDETVQQLEQAEWQGVKGFGASARQRAPRRRPPARRRSADSRRKLPNPFGLGALIDIQI